MRWSAFFVSLLTPALISASTIDATKYPRSIKLTYQFLQDDPTTQSHPLAEIHYNPSTGKTHLSSWTPPSDAASEQEKGPKQSAPLVRISLPDGTSSITGLSTFDPNLSQHINLLLSSGSSSTSSADKDSKEVEIVSANIVSISPPPLSEEEIRQRKKEERLKARGKTISSSSKTKSKTKTKTKAKTAAAAATNQAGKAQEQEEANNGGGPIVKINLHRASPGPRPELLTRAPPKVDNEGREVVSNENQPEKTFFQKYWWVFMAGALLLMTSSGGIEEPKKK